MKHLELACVCEVESNLIKELDVEFVDEVKQKIKSKCPKYNLWVNVTLCEYLLECVGV
jgi:hypothetical protein